MLKKILKKNYLTSFNKFRIAIIGFKKKKKNIKILLISILLSCSKLLTCECYPLVDFIFLQLTNSFTIRKLATIENGDLRVVFILVNLSNAFKSYNFDRLLSIRIS